MTAVPSVGAPQGPIQLKGLVAQPPWEAYWLPLSGFPVPEHEVAPLREFLRALTGSLMKAQGLSLEVLIQFNQVYLGDGPSRFSDHAREWMPQQGLGIWPDRDPPTLWSLQDFERLAPGEKLRNFMYQLFRVSGPQAVKENARDVMLGLGTIVEILAPGSTDALLEQSRQLFLPPIKERAFRSFPFYLPLVERKSLEGAKPGQLDEWFCGATVYIRESSEDTAVLIACRTPLAPVLENLGARLESEWEWRIPA